MFLFWNAQWRGLGLEAWRWAFTARVGGVYQPLAWLSWGVDYALWGLDARGYHLQNVLWHAIAAALAFLVARRLLAAARAARPGEPTWSLEAAAFFAALVFAAHPLRVESVTWIAERRDVICGAFSLAAALAYLKARQPARAPGSLIATATFLFLALAAKGMAVTLPAVLIVVDFYPLRRVGPRGAGLRAVVLEKWPLFLIAALFAAVGVSAQDRLHLGWDQHGAAARAAQAAYALAFYVRKTAWPFGLAPMYELRPPLDWTEPRFLTSVAAAAAAVGACGFWRRKRPWLAAALAAYALALFPVSGLFQFGSQLVADRYSYLPCFPFAVIAGAALRAGLSMRRVLASACAVAVAAALAAGTIFQQSYWSGNEVLWSRVLAVDPASGIGHLGLGTAIASPARLPEARAQFEAALAAYPGCAAEQDGLASLLAQGDRSSPEFARLNHAVDTRPVCRLARANLGAALAMGGDLRGAERVLLVVAAISPDDENSRANLARVEALLAGRRPHP